MPAPPPSMKIPSRSTAPLDAPTDPWDDDAPCQESWPGRNKIYTVQDRNGSRSGPFSPHRPPYSDHSGNRNKITEQAMMPTKEPGVYLRTLPGPQRVVDPRVTNVSSCAARSSSSPPTERAPVSVCPRLDDDELRRVFREELQSFFGGVHEHSVPGQGFFHQLAAHLHLANHLHLAKDAQASHNVSMMPALRPSTSALGASGSPHGQNGFGAVPRTQSLRSTSEIGADDSPRGSQAGNKYHAKSGRAAAPVKAIQALKAAPFGDVVMNRAATRPIVETIEEYYALTEPKREGRMADVVQSSKFGVFVGLVIAANAIFQMYTTNWKISHIGEDWPDSIRAGEVLFLCAYSLEIILKFWVHRLYFFWCEDMYWNSFDLLLVLVSTVSVATMYTSLEAPNLSYLRLIRFMKFGKILRIVRLMHIVRDLRLIVSSIVGSMTSFLWSMVMFSITFFLFGTLFVEGAEECLSQGCTADLNTEVEETLLKRFDSVQSAMVSMFMAITGGDDWSRFYTALYDIGWGYGMLYLFCIAFCNFALMNILTGIFMENAMNLAKPDREAMAIAHQQQELNQIRSLTELFHEMDKDGSGKMRLDEFISVIKDSPKVSAFFHAQGLEIKDAEMFFKMLQDADHEGEPVDIDSFVDGCMKMKGGARSLDLQALRFRLRTMRRNQNDFFKDMSRKMNALIMSVGIPVDSHHFSRDSHTGSPGHQK